MRLATFNILNGRSLDDDRVDVDRFAGAVRSLDADLLALQEVDRGQQRSAFTDLTEVAAEAMGAASHRFAPALCGTPGAAWAPAAHRDVRRDQPAYGVALLSRLPVRAWRVVPLPALPFPSPWVWSGSRRLSIVRDEPRVAVVAEVEAPGGAVTVVCTHLSFLPGWNVVQLRRLVAALRPSTGPLVLMGDLNMGRRPAETCTGLRSTVVGPTFPSTGPSRQLDHVLVRGLHGPFRGGPQRQPLSDHCALVVDL